MHSTPASLLARLRQPDTSPGDWERFVRLYAPLLHSWARRAGVQEHDAADLVQDVLVVVVNKMPDFQYDPARSFRAWLHAVLLNRWRQKCRTQAATVELREGEAAGPDPAAAFEKEEYTGYLLRRACGILQSDFQPATWQAFWQHAVEGRRADEVAASLGMSVKAVYLARARVLRRLREELAGLLD